MVESALYGDGAGAATDPDSDGGLLELLETDSQQLDISALTAPHIPSAPPAPVPLKQSQDEIDAEVEKVLKSKELVKFMRDTPSKKKERCVDHRSTACAHIQMVQVIR